MSKLSQITFYLLWNYCENSNSDPARRKRSLKIVKPLLKKESKNEHLQLAWWSKDKNPQAAIEQ